MSHVIDSLVVELGLDASKFNQQQQQAIDRAKGNVDQFRRQGNEVESIGGGMIDGFKTLQTQALKFFTVLTGAKGIVDFTANTIQTGAALGRLSRAIGQSSTQISKWQGVAKEFGSTGEQMAASFQQISNVFTAWQVGGPEAPGIMQIFRAINTEAQRLDANNARQIDSTKTLNENYLALSQNLKIIHDLAGDKNLASYLAGKVPGMDAGMFDMMIQGADRLEEHLKKVQGWTDAEAEAAGRVQRRWDGAKVSLDNYLKTKIFEGADAATPLAKELNKSFMDAKPWDAIFGWGEYATKKPGNSLLQPSVNAESVSGGFRTQAQKEDFIRGEAQRRGIDPNFAMAVARSEGFNSFVSSIPGETSYGAFQLHTTPGGRGRAVGDLFREKTGLDPSKKENEAATITFALDWAKQHGWKDFHGAANGAHLSNWAGIDRSGAGGSSTNVVEINGPVTVQTQSGTAEEIGGKLRALGRRRQAEANQSYVGGE
jgi:hypothetical protein